MPYYRRRSYRPRRTIRRRRVLRRRAVPKPIKRYIARRFPRPELKRISSVAMDEVTQDTLGSTFALTELSNIAQGNTVYSRVGNEVIIKGIHLKGVVHNNASKANYVRMLLLGTTDSVDTNTATGEFFDTSVTGVGDTPLSVTGLNQIYCRINKAKFTVYYDKLVRLGANSATDGSQTRPFNIFKKFNRRIKYEGNTYGAGNQSWRYIWVTIVGEGADDSVGSATVEFNAQTMLYFTDV